MLICSLALAASLLALQARAETAAPDFTLSDLDGGTVKLADLRGKVVVLEWFNPECPFVQRSHTEGSLVGLSKRYAAKGIAWYAINSGAPGKQGSGAETNRKGQQALHVDNPILLDETGVVGKAYGATNTPHMFVIDPSGNLVYSGAIDNSPDGEGKSPEGGTLVNYVEQALEDVAAKRPVRTPKTKAYGCSVKYGS
jgi:peroxiredoxin